MISTYSLCMTKQKLFKIRQAIQHERKYMYSKRPTPISIPYNIKFANNKLINNAMLNKNSRPTWECLAMCFLLAYILHDCFRSEQVQSLTFQKHTL